MKQKYVTALPAHQINFFHPLKKGSVANLTLLNFSQHTVIFKLKTTSPELFCCRPVYQFLERGHQIEVNIQLRKAAETIQPNAEVDRNQPRSRRGFMVLAYPLEGGAGYPDADHFWTDKLYDKRKLQKKFLDVIFNLPAKQTTIIQKSVELIPKTLNRPSSLITHPVTPPPLPPLHGISNQRSVTKVLVKDAAVQVSVTEQAHLRSVASLNGWLHRLQADSDQLTKVMQHKMIGQEITAVHSDGRHSAILDQNHDRNPDYQTLERPPDWPPPPLPLLSEALADTILDGGAPPSVGVQTSGFAGELNLLRAYELQEVHTDLDDDEAEVLKLAAEFDVWQQLQHHQTDRSLHEVRVVLKNGRQTTDSDDE